MNFSQISAFFGCLWVILEINVHSRRKLGGGGGGGGVPHLYVFIVFMSVAPHNTHVRN